MVSEQKKAANGRLLIEEMKTYFENIMMIKRLELIVQIR